MDPAHREHLILHLKSGRRSYLDVLLLLINLFSMLSPFCFIVNMSIPYLIVSILIATSTHSSYARIAMLPLFAQKKVPDKGPDRLYRNPLIVRLISLRLAPSSKGVAGFHRSYVSPPLLIRDIKYSINITA